MRKRIARILLFLTIGILVWFIVATLVGHAHVLHLPVMNICNGANEGEIKTSLHVFRKYSAHLCVCAPDTNSVSAFHAIEAVLSLMSKTGEVLYEQSCDLSLLDRPYRMEVAGVKMWCYKVLEMEEFEKHVSSLLDSSGQCKLKAWVGGLGSETSCKWCFQVFVGLK